MPSSRLKNVITPMSLAWETKVFAGWAGATEVSGNAMSDIRVVPCKAILQRSRRGDNVIASDNRGGDGDGFDAGGQYFIDILQGYPRNCDRGNANFRGDLAGKCQTGQEIAGFCLAAENR